MRYRSTETNKPVCVVGKGVPMGSQWWRMDSIKGGENPVQAPSGCALVRMSGREVEIIAEGGGLG